MQNVPKEFQAKSTATVSVALSPDELALVKLAAARSSLSVSAWGAARVAAVCTPPQLSSDLVEQARNATTDGRTARASTVIMRDAHDLLRGRAEAAGVTIHNVVQAVFLASAAAETSRMKASERAAAVQGIVAARPAPRAKGLTADLPKAVAERNASELTATIDVLLSAAIAKTFKGDGPKMKAGMERLVRALPKDDLVRVALPVDPDLLRACSLVLTIDAGLLLAALAVKAASAA